MKTIVIKKRTKELSEMLTRIGEQITYPYGDDFFCISHGEDYFQFFDRLGKPFWTAHLDTHHQISSQLCAILRKVPLRNRFASAWYLCDLKKDQHYASPQTFSKLFKHFMRLTWRCQRGYAISMNRQDGKNPFGQVVKKTFFFPGLKQEILNIYSCDYDCLQKILPLIEEQRGRVSYLSLRNIKDIVLQKTGVMPLFHLQFGPLATKEPTSLTSLADHTYMWCALSSDPFTKKLREQDIHPSATASLFSFRMQGSDFSWVLTSDI